MVFTREIEINTLGDLESRTEWNKALNEYFLRSENYVRLSEFSRLRLNHNHSLRILDSKEKCDIELLENSPKIEEFLSQSSRTSYNTIKEGLTKLNIPFTENPFLFRGLDYYNELCFEIKYAKDEKEKPKDTLLGGGRYDTLIGILKGQNNPQNSIPALGYHLGSPIKLRFIC